MKKIFSLLLATLVLLGALTACNGNNPADTTDTTDNTDNTTDTSVEDTTADTEPVEEIPVYKEPITVAYDGFTLDISAPTVVFQGEEGDQTWGHHQFPRLYRSGQLIIASWQYGEDKVGGVSTGFSKLSVNGGKTWVPNSGGNAADQTIQMANGKYFAGFVSAGTPQTKFLDAYTPETSWGATGNVHKMYFAEDVAEDPVAIEKRLTTLAFNEYDPETKTTTAVEATLNWPYAPMVVYPGNYVYSLSGYFSLSGTNVIATADGTLYTCIYCPGFDSFAASREEAATDYAKKGFFHIYVFKSADSGRTWDLISQVTPGEEADPTAKNFEGYCEPKMIEMPDGSFLMLMRIGGSTNNPLPMYVTRSTDGGATWTTPEVFDEFGVLPQLAQIGDGITVASYGRPYLRLCVTDDPTGAVWEDPIEIPLAGNNGGKNESCFYTSMLQLDENSLLLIYTSFRYPNKNGVGVRTVLTRTVTVTPNT